MIFSILIELLKKFVIGINEFWEGNILLWLLTEYQIRWSTSSTLLSIYIISFECISPCVMNILFSVFGTRFMFNIQVCFFISSVDSWYHYCQIRTLSLLWPYSKIILYYTHFYDKKIVQFWCMTTFSFISVSLLLQLFIHRLFNILLFFELNAGFIWILNIIIIYSFLMIISSVCK